MSVKNNLKPSHNLQVSLCLGNVCKTHIIENGSKNNTVLFCTNNRVRLGNYFNLKLRIFRFDIYFTYSYSSIL
jgi:hypothetical protein